MPDPKHYRTVFISDLHLGAAGCKTSAVQAFLRSMSCDTLYLVGDLIDGWVAHEKKWSQNHTDVIRTLLKFSENGTCIRYTPGNHDAFIRRLNGSTMGLIEIDHSFSHTTADDKRLLIVHGDLFDPSCTKHTRIAYAGAWIYEYIQLFNGQINRRTKRKYDFASSFKRATKRLFAKKGHFDALLIEHAAEEGYDGIVCGHIHRPEIQFGPDGVGYYNCGDWVEHCTALVEHEDGRMEVLWWDAKSESAQPKIAAELTRKTVFSRGASILANRRSRRRTKTLNLSMKPTKMHRARTTLQAVQCVSFMIVIGQFCLQAWVSSLAWGTFCMAISLALLRFKIQPATTELPLNFLAEASATTPKPSLNGRIHR